MGTFSHFLTELSPYDMILVGYYHFRFLFPHHFAKGDIFFKIRIPNYTVLACLSLAVLYYSFRVNDLD